MEAVALDAAVGRWPRFLDFARNDEMGDFTLGATGVWIGQPLRPISHLSRLRGA